jgi:hypothetical protein
MNINEQYLESIKKRFADYKSLAEKAIAQIKDEDLFKSPNESGIESGTNSIAIIIQHLWGNMMSRWTNFLTEDGEKEWRERDAEFENVVKTKEELMQKWEEGWKCMFDTLNSLKPEELLNTIYIRGEAHTAMDAINRQLAHYPYHIGQIVYAAKMLKGNGFQSLSIPKGKSKEFNAGMMKK